jgi:hypothetical protein
VTTVLMRAGRRSCAGWSSHLRRRFPGRKTQSRCQQHRQFQIVLKAYHNVFDGPRAVSFFDSFAVPILNPAGAHRLLIGKACGFC